jgi:hypothetical protein
MPAPDLKSDNVNASVILQLDNQIIEDGEVEWYSGNELYTRPRRIKIRGIWEDVFHSDKDIEENEKHERKTVFHCNIGDNRMITVIISTV